ncbi:hypothetical protein BsWGS_10515 [Bradybaena similaris]
MNLSNNPYNHGPSDFSGRAAFCDSHSNISISAVISSSCVVLGGLRDTAPDCLSTVFPIAQDGPSFFTSEGHASMSPSLQSGNLSTLPNIVNRLGANNSLNSPSTDRGYENHFFESAATEFTTAGNEINVTTDRGRSDIQLSTDNEAAIDVPDDPYYDDNADDQDNEGCAVNIFTYSNKQLNRDGYVFSSPARDSDTGYSRNCRANTTASIFYSSNQDNDSTLESPYECGLLSKTGAASLRDNITSFMPIVDVLDQGTDTNMRFWRNNNSVQSRTPSPFKDMAFSCHQDAKGNTLNTQYDFITLQKRINLSPHNILDSGSQSFSAQSESLVSYAKNSSFQPYSLSHCEYEVSGCHETVSRRSLCNSLSDSASMNADSFRHMCAQLPSFEDNRKGREEHKEVKYSSAEHSSDTIHSMRVKYTPEKGGKFTSKKQFNHQNTNIECGQENYNFTSSPNSISENDTLKGTTSMDADRPTNVVSTGKAKRKHVETVESLQLHLEMLEDKRKKKGLPCSSLSFLRQRSQVAEDKLADDRGAAIVDVDHMMCSGVTVAGFKPRAIIRKRIKTTTPTDVKDMEYWQKRRKNNDSARKSRESKKEKEKNFYKRALELEYENLYLQECLSLAEAELANLGHPFVPPVFGGQCYY